jgi:hypothetical protein
LEHPLPRGGEDCLCRRWFEHLRRFWIVIKDMVVQAAAEDKRITDSACLYLIRHRRAKGIEIASLHINEEFVVP